MASASPVRIVNPPKKRRRRRSAEAAPAPKGRRRRRNNPGKRRKGRRRRNNPGFLSGVTGFAGGGVLGRLGGEVFCAWIVNLWGQRQGPSNLGGGATDFAGQPWTLTNYALVYIGARFAAPMFAKIFGAQFQAQFMDGVKDTMVRKFLWSEGIARNAWTNQHFGETTNYDSNGNVWLKNGNQWESMQGLQPARALDNIVTQSAMDGLVSAGPTDVRSLGHAVTHGDEAAERNARFHSAGAKSAFHYAYQSI